MTAIVLKQDPNKIFFLKQKNTRHKNDTVQPKTDKWLSSPSHPS